MIKTIKAAVLEKINSKLKIIDLQVPKLTHGQVLVKIFFSGACRSQLMEIVGGRNNQNWLPHLLGHEGSGEIVEVGSGVSKFKPGDKVILGWIKGKGIEAESASFSYENQIINSGKVTTFSNYSIVSENRLVMKPKHLSFEEAVLFGCAIQTGAGMVFNELKISREDNVIVLGLGGIGLSALIALKTLNIEKIIALDISNEKLNLAKELGATHIFNTQRSDLKSEINKIFKEGANFCIESCGKASTIELGFSLLNKKNGELIFASHPPKDEKISLNPHELISGKKIRGSWGGACLPDKDVPKISDAFNSSNVQLKKLLSKKYKLEQINDALTDLKTGKVTRPLIEMEH